MIETMEAQNGYFRKADDTVENFAVKDGFHITDTEKMPYQQEMRL